MQSSRGPDDGIITVSGKQSKENMDPIGLQLHSLRRVPPLLQESQDPAWRGLQQDLQIMHRKDADMHINPQPILNILEKYKAWSKAHCASIVQDQENIGEKADQVWSQASRVIADLSRAASLMSTAAKHATLAEDLVQRMTELEVRLQQCRVEAATIQEAQEAGAHAGDSIPG
ncbi:hypothetical protein CVIRNUC_007983 [Coccomyxa viridis]|uniref:BLOC-1-related complex subunit 7 n=1 Tax=Coccomyxa viridis TaxID=1274662 RepID=A0AAV1ICN8_9CHLO|nr:hypothetical protein CVIRNUC_007983 [Coccomyxa viridis]